MKTQVISESGYTEALFGLGLSYGLTSGMKFVDFKAPWNASHGDIIKGAAEVRDRLERLVKKLAHRDGGHNKFLETIIVNLDITAPRYWWQEFDTYRIGVTKQSESTMHTLRKRPVDEYDFEDYIPEEYLLHINDSIKFNASLQTIKGLLPESFLQRRIVCTNYKALRGILWQREGHRLKLWDQFRAEVLAGVQHPQFLVNITESPQE